MNGIQRVRVWPVWVTSLEPINGRVQRDRVWEPWWRGQGGELARRGAVGAGDKEAEGCPANEEAERCAAAQTGGLVKVDDATTRPEGEGTGTTSV